jgi:hypothetical protein
MPGGLNFVAFETGFCAETAYGMSQNEESEGLHMHLRTLSPQGDLLRVHHVPSPRPAIAGLLFSG